MQPAPDLASFSWNMAQVTGVLIPLCISTAQSDTHKHWLSLPPTLSLTHTIKYTHTLSSLLTCRYSVHIDTIEHTHASPETPNPRLKASATLNMGVYYMAGTQERCLWLHFCSSLTPLTSVFECSIVALHHCLNCFSACRICLPAACFLPLLPFLQNNMVGWHLSSHSPSMNIFVFAYLHT